MCVCVCGVRACLNTAARQHQLSTCHSAKAQSVQWATSASDTIPSKNATTPCTQDPTPFLCQKHSSLPATQTHRPPEAVKATVRTWSLVRHSTHFLSSCDQPFAGFSKTHQNKGCQSCCLWPELCWERCIMQKQSQCKLTLTEIRGLRVKLVRILSIISQWKNSLG